MSCKSDDSIVTIFNSKFKTGFDILNLKDVKKYLYTKYLNVILNRLKAKLWKLKLFNLD